MPQLSQLALVYQSQWFWLLLVLAVIYFFVGRGIVTKVEDTVDDRDARIEADLAEAERLRDEADRTEEAWRTRINEAQQKAQSELASAKSAADLDVEKRIASADAEIEAKADEAAAALGKSRQSALAEVEAVAAEAASDIVTRLSGATVNKDDALRAVAGVVSNG